MTRKDVEEFVEREYEQAYDQDVKNQINDVVGDNDEDLNLDELLEDDASDIEKEDDTPSGFNFRMNVGKKKDMSGNAVRERFFEIMEKYHSGDEFKKGEAVTDALGELEGFICSIIKRSYSTYTKEYFYDLLQEGRLGVLVGLEKYDPSISMPSTFFFPYIKHELQGFITRNVDRTTSHYSSNIKRITKVIDSFEEAGVKYTPVDIAIQTGMTVETVIKSMNIKKSREEIHIDGMANNILEDTTNDDFKTPENAFIEKEENEILENTISDSLTNDEIKVLDMRFGLHDSVTYPEGEIAKMMKIPKDRVKMLQNSAIRKLRNSKLKDLYKDNLKTEKVLIEKSIIPIVSRESAIRKARELEDVDINF